MTTTEFDKLLKYGKPTLQRGELLHAVKRGIATGMLTELEVRDTAQAVGKAREEKIVALTNDLLKLGPQDPKNGHPRRRFQHQEKLVAEQKQRKFTMTPKARAARKLQGRYMAGLRKLGAAHRAQAKKIARTKGVPAALKFIEKKTS